MLRFLGCRMPQPPLSDVDRDIQKLKENYRLPSPLEKRHEPKIA